MSELERSFGDLLYLVHAAGTPHHGTPRRHQPRHRHHPGIFHLPKRISPGCSTQLAEEVFRWLPHNARAGTMLPHTAASSLYIRKLSLLTERGNQICVGPLAWDHRIESLAACLAQNCMSNPMKGMLQRLGVCVSSACMSLAVSEKRGD